MSFREQLLQVMDQKQHWGWNFLSSGGLLKSQLKVHFQQEYETYIRDFPIFLARILGKMGAQNSDLKQELAANLYEEQTGGLSQKYSKGKSHPELFLKMMKGLGYKTREFDQIKLLPTSLAYRCFLDHITLNDDWRVAATIMTIFVEGSVHDRQQIKNKYKQKVSISKKINEHALVKFYDLKTSDADLIKVHHSVEGDHRKSAWDSLLKIIPQHLHDHTVERMEQALELWLLFRDGVCVEMGVEYPLYREIMTGQSS